MDSVLTTVDWLLRKTTDKVVKRIFGSAALGGNLKQSLLVVVVVTTQLLVSVAVAHAIIFFLLLTSGDVEQNPGPGQFFGE